AHDPEKWIPVFRKDHAQTISVPSNSPCPTDRLHRTAGGGVAPCSCTVAIWRADQWRPGVRRWRWRSPAEDNDGGGKRVIDEIDRPDVVAEVAAEFERYERALMANDVPALNAFFRVDPRTIRYGAAEILHGHAEISAFRTARSPVGLARTLSRTVISAY